MSASAFLPVVVIFGAGRNIGANVARVFANKGYKVALAARRLQNEQVEEGQLHIHADLADPNSVISAFDSVEKTFGPANVVIYNGAYLLESNSILLVSKSFTKARLARLFLPRTHLSFR